MIKLITDSIPHAFKFAHSATLMGLKRMGWDWEVRRRGELCLGVLSKTFEKKSNSTAREKGELIFIGGFGDTPLSWFQILIPLLPIVRRRYSAVRIFDFPGFAGFLSDQRPIHSMDRLQEFCLDTLETFKPKTIIGHSLGGWLATAYVAELKERAEKNRLTKPYFPKRLILVCPGGVLNGEEKRAHWKRVFYGAIEGGFREFQPHVFYNEPIWFKWVEDSFSEFFDKPEILQFMESVEDRHLLNDKLKDLDVDIQLIVGENDSMIPAAWADDWIELGRKSHIEKTVLKGVGHSPQIEAPLRMIKLLKNKI